MSQQPTLFDPAPDAPVLTGTIEQDGRAYAYTLRPDRLTLNDRLRRGGNKVLRAPTDWALTITFELTGLTREVQNYDKRDALWAVIREREDVRAALGAS